MLAKQPFESVSNRKLGRRLVGGSEKSTQPVLPFIRRTRCVLAHLAALQHALGASVLPFVRHESCKDFFSVAQIILFVSHRHIFVNLAAKVRNLREKTSGMYAKKLYVSSNWLIYSHKKIIV